MYAYDLPGGWRVLAGRSAEDNDCLSLEVAEAEDWWFHVCGMSGSHVILKARPGEEPPRETLRQAAAIAAYHSKARASGRVKVICTRARQVSKPRGAPPGTVAITGERTMTVRPALPAGQDAP